MLFGSETWRSTKQMSTVLRHLNNKDIEPSPLIEKWTGTHWTTNRKKKVELDWIHPTKTGLQHPCESLKWKPHGEEGLQKHSEGRRPGREWPQLEKLSLNQVSWRTFVKSNQSLLVAYTVKLMLLSRPDLFHLSLCLSPHPPGVAHNPWSIYTCVLSLCASSSCLPSQPAFMS
jgi:hypothetical protein